MRAILAGRKTQTRRVVKLPGEWAQPLMRWGDGFMGLGAYVYEAEYPDEGSVFLRCPYGVPGDRLWCRETWTAVGWDGVPPREMSRPAMILHLADDPESKPDDGPWRPSIHMPRWASRLSLGISDVRVQRLQEISEEDVRAEGVIPVFDPQFAFAMLWDSFQLRRKNPAGLSWADNPFVWCITFRKL